MLLSRLQMKQELIAEYKDLLPAMPPDQWRRVRGEQEIIVRYAPEEALATLPELLRDEGDRARLVTLARRLLADERVQRAKPTTEQLAMIDNIGSTLAVDTKVKGKAPRRPGRKRARKPVRKPTRKPATSART